MYEFLTSTEVYNFIKGPLVWVSFIIFIGGSIYRVVSLLYRVRKAKVIYTYLSVRYSLRSIFHWIIPFASTQMRKRPWITIISFLFHICLVLTPVFLLSHNMLLRDSWNIRWWTLPEGVADVMTLIVILCTLFFLMRRLIAPEVRFVTSVSDYVLLAMVAAPFSTGFLAFNQLFFDYNLIVTFHILFGEIMLIAIPFTRLRHMLLFWLTRAYTGSEFGSVRHSKDF